MQKHIFGLIIIVTIGTIAIIIFKNKTSIQNSKKAYQYNATLETATLAGGCFWCMQPPFQKIDGVVEVVSGYTDGKGENPTYKNYAQMGYLEAIQINYDPKKVSYNQLLDIFWRQIDPTDAGGQFVDRGPQYRSAIFYHTDKQKTQAEKSKEALQKSGLFKKPIETEIVKASTFYKAEEYHQDYSKKNPIRYKLYRYSSGRDKFLKKIWKQKSNEWLRKTLTPLQYEVTQENGTEPAFKNKYWDNKRAGIYVDIISGKPLFSSLDKFVSGTGWPSFTKPLEPANIVEKKHKGLISTTIEIRSKHSDAHLGDLFYDGPKPKGLRYCINSAALHFIPVEDLEKYGYEEYKKLFE